MTERQTTNVIWAVVLYSAGLEAPELYSLHTDRSAAMQFRNYLTGKTGKNYEVIDLILNKRSDKPIL